MRVQIASDSFAYSLGHLQAVSTSWIDTDNGFNGYVQVVAANAILATSSGVLSDAYWSGAGTFTADQYATLAIDTLGMGNDSLGVVARSNTGNQGASTNSCYRSYIFCNAGSGQIVLNLVKVVNNSVTSLGTDTTQSALWAVGDTVEIEAQGTTIRALRNGVAIITVTDSALASGKPGVCAAVGATSLTGTNWAGGNLVTGQITPPAGALAFAGAAAIVSLGTVTAPPSAALAFTGHAPTVTTTPTISPPSGSVAFTGHAPAVTQQVTIAPTAGAAAFSGHAPTVTVGGASTSITPPAGSLAFTGAVSGQTLTLPPPSAGQLTFSGAAPTVTQGTVQAPTAGTLAFTGHAPVVAQGTVISPPAGALSASGHAPLVSVTGSLVPNAGALAFTGAAPLVTQQWSVTASAGSLGFTGHAPRVTQGSTTVSAGPRVTIKLAGYDPRIRLRRF